MFRKLAAFLFLAVLVSSADSAIDLTPATKEYTREGFVYTQVTFKADKGTVIFNPPQGWTISGGKDRAQLTPQGKRFAEASIQATPSIAPQLFEEAALKTLEQKVLAEVPTGSQSIMVVKREQNPVMIGQNPSFEFVVSYQALGQLFLRSVIFVATPDTQLTFRVSAPKADFEALSTSFRRSISSWHLVEAKSASASAQALAPTAPPPVSKPN